LSTIGLFLGTTEDAYGKDVVKGVLEGLAADTRLLCFTAGTIHSRHGFEAQRNVLYDLVDERSVDALIVAGSLSHNVSSDELLAFCERYDPVPMVMMSVTLPGIPSVTIDNRAGMAAMLDHLLNDHGFTRLAFVGGPPGQQEAETRKQVFLEALAKAGREVRADWLVDGDFTRESGRAAARRLEATLLPGRPRFQVVVCANDSMALGVQDYLTSLGWRVPDDCALTGFDDGLDAQLANPPLTTVHQPVDQVAAAAARMADNRAHGANVDSQTLKPVLQVRRSCGCSPAPRSTWTLDDWSRKLAEAEGAWAEEARQNAAMNHQLERLRGATENLLTSDSLTSLLHVLRESLQSMGFAGFWLSLFEDPARPGETSRLHLAQEPNGTIFSSPQGKAFASRELIPGGLAGLEDAPLVVVEALYARHIRLGFLVLVADRTASQITGTLRGQVSGALQAVLLLEERKRTERQLIQSEKMAALGSLVAGVAHEINTPLGVAITASSYLDDQARTWTPERPVEALVRDLRLATAALQTNLGRAADLVASFKQVSADQMTETRRTFDLQDYLKDTLLSLQFQWKQRPVTVTLDGHGALGLDSYPGAVVQVVTNLVANSLLHAFPADRAGQIRLDLDGHGERVRLLYEDDGVGIPESLQARVFEPFFTTKRGKGGTGLGLHIVFNVVTTVLGGTIAFASEPEQGTRFEITLPRTAPDRRVSNQKREGERRAP